MLKTIFVKAVEQNAVEVAFDDGIDEDYEPRIIFSDVPIVGREEEVVSFEPSTSRPSSALSNASSYASILSEIGPLQAGIPKQKSKRGRKAIKSSVLTSPENIAVLKKKAAEKKEKEQKKAAPKKVIPKNATPKKATPKKKSQKKVTPPAKRPKAKTSPSSDEDEDFCIICLTLMPNILTASNSIKCNTCQRPVHLKCANMSESYFTCKHCDTDYDEEYDDEQEDDE